ncbi:MAG: hypothetical protein E7441_06090 [Ruminococcaceae bacterium]|nr:hypothetical protein [Oscillospiraceae bacterium]
MDYRKYLTEEILPFWLKYGIDEECGGILHQLDRAGNVYSTDKNVWFIGRALWTFSVAYNTVEKNPEYLKACETLFRFYDKCTLPNGRLPYLCARDGTPVEIRDYYYSEAFAAIGCMQYYRACKRPEVLKRAEGYFDVLYSLYKNPETKSPELNSDNPCNVFGLEMIMLSVAQFMRNAGINTEKYDALAKEAIYNIQNGGYVKDDLRTVREYIPIDGAVLSEPVAEYICPGHLYEAAWFVFCEGELKNDNEIRAFGRKLLDYAIPDADKDSISVIRTGRLNPANEDYIWWPQCEAIIAYRLAYNIFGDNEYKKLADRIEAFAFSHFADTEHGEWFEECTQTGEVVSTNKGTVLKGPFHLPRMLFVLISLTETGSILKYLS